MARDEPTEQERAREREAQRLARALATTTLLQDPLAWARDYWAEAGEGGWRYLPRVAFRHDPPNPEAIARGLPAARAAISRKDDHA